MANNEPLKNSKATPDKATIDDGVKKRGTGKKKKLSPDRFEPKGLNTALRELISDDVRRKLL